MIKMSWSIRSISLLTLRDIFMLRNVGAWGRFRNLIPTEIWFWISQPIMQPVVLVEVEDAQWGSQLMPKAIFSKRNTEAVFKSMTLVGTIFPISDNTVRVMAIFIIRTALHLTLQEISMSLNRITSAFRNLTRMEILY